MTSLFCHAKLSQLKLARPNFNVGLAAVLGLSGLTVGCASTGNITPQYVAPSTYQNYDCNGLSGEYTRLNRYVIEAQNSRTSSIATTGVGIGLSAGRWGISPNINVGLGKSNTSQARDAKLSRLYGERDAIIQSARMQRCAFADGLKIYGE